MPTVWVEPEHSRRAVDRAGAVLVSPWGETGAVTYESLQRYSEAIAVINNWRAAHSFPLNTFTTGLRRKARLVDQNALVAQRTKRLASVEAKLRNNVVARLSDMQDIGGCRAILNSVASVRQLVRDYDRSGLKHVRASTDDYLDEPRESGYRGIHLIYRYHSDRKQTYNGLRVEMQIRTNMQHAWATAVETVGTLLSQSLKSNQGSDDWLRFFALMGTWMAVREGTARVPGTPDTDAELKEELHYLVDELGVQNRLRTYSQVVQVVERPAIRRQRSLYSYFLLVLDPTGENQVRVIPYGIAELEEATEQYAELEQEVRDRPGGEAVLVAVDDLAAISRAYPNYFLDTSSFLDEVAEATAS